MKFNIGIIGAGFVGGSICRGFNLYCNIKIYDKDPKRRIHSLEETCKSDFVFLCLPSPMTKKEGGPTDLSIIHSVCKTISENKFTNPVYILKSTVPIGTTESIRQQYGLKIIHNPEFLTARNADIDFLTSHRTILGGNKDWCESVSELFKYRFPGNSVMYVTSNESEAIKYVINAFFAVKVMFFNEVKLGLEKPYELNWDKVLEGVLTDGRIGISHYQVPGHDGKYSFGGFCLPKDLCSIIEQISKYGFDPKMLKACWEHNKELRPEMDWASSPSAVTESCNMSTREDKSENT